MPSQRLDQVRARAFAAIGRLPVRLGQRLLRANEALGRPLADADELADRRAFARGEHAAPAASAAPAPAPASAPTREAAPVIVYHLDKHKRDVSRLTQPLDARDIPYRVMNLEGDPATLTAVRRDAGGRKLPLVFIAGECAGGREELQALDDRGDLLRKVYGS